MLIEKKAKLILVLAYIAAAAVITVAKPAFMDRYNNDPYSKAELRGKCTVCHIGKGGGERNDFGEAFEDTGYRITPKLRAKFPKLFESEPR
ncbi:MAG: hypothetical protein ABJB97_10990 [Acidobacteriota bacterium]